MSGIVIKHFGKIVNGIKSYYNYELYKANLAEIESFGGEFVETIKLKGKRISTDTYAYFFGGVVKTALEFEIFRGWTKEEVRWHYEDMLISEDIMTKKLIGAVTKLEIERKHRSIADLNQKEMNEFIERCIEDLGQKGIVVLSPEQYQLSTYATITKK